MAESVPFTDRVCCPFPVLSPFPLPFPHRVVSATAVQPALAQRASTVLTVILPFFYRAVTDLVSLVYRHPYVFITFYRIRGYWYIDTLGRIYLSLIQCCIKYLSLCVNLCVCLCVLLCVYLSIHPSIHPLTHPPTRILHGRRTEG